MGDTERAVPLQAIVFSVEGKTLAIDILQVREILRMVEITPFPRMPAFALGAINVRGRVVPVINLRGKLGLPERPADARTCIMLVTAGAHVVSFLVDEVAEVVALPEAAVEPPGEGPAWMRSELFSGIGKLPGRMLLIVNPDRLLSAQEERQLPGALAAAGATPEARA
jgi:purine-binding chemotaxis protein CheW